MEEKDAKGFTFKDRRKVSLDDLDHEKSEKNTEERQEGKNFKQDERAEAEIKEASEKCSQESNIPLPEVSFSTFVLSLSSSALVHLGDIPDPSSQRSDKDLPMAKQIIDTLGMLQEKTQGNLNTEEERLVKTLLYDLRLRYVQKCEK